MFASFMIQHLVIYPIESNIRTDNFEHIVSLVYLPHGIKIIYAILLGPISFFHIVASDIVAFLIYFGEIPPKYMTGSSLAAISTIVPIILLNASMKKAIFSPPVNYDVMKINVVWIFFSITLFSALLNSTFHMKLYFEVVDIDVFTYFIIGDFCGAIVIFMLFLFVYRPIMNKVLLRK